MKYFSIDLKNLKSDVVGSEYGADFPDIKATYEPEFHRIRSLLEQQRESDNTTYINVDRDRSRIDHVLNTAAELKGKYENLLVIGIGGSTWGTIAIHTALNHAYHNDTTARPRFYVLDNSDPEEVEELLEQIDLRRTLVNVVSKSGGTPETMANFAIVLERMRELNPDHFAQQIVATTDAGDGLLQRMGRDFGFRVLDMPPGVGGRFSLMTAVGMFPAAMLGLPVEELLQGAQATSEEALNPDFRSNELFVSAFCVHRFLEKAGRNIMVMMPYHRKLRYVSSWYMQLWAESLGKKVNRAGDIVNTGTTPLGALGAADQHSLNQLFMEGPQDKLVTFLRVEAFNRRPGIPEWVKQYDKLAYLAGHTMEELINAEQTATAAALAAEKRGSRTFVLPRLTPAALGALFQYFEIETHIFGELYHINTFDQPGVELGKVITRESLQKGRPADV